MSNWYVGGLSFATIPVAELARTRVPAPLLVKLTLWELNWSWPSCRLAPLLTANVGPLLSETLPNVIPAVPEATFAPALIESVVAPIVSVPRVSVTPGPEVRRSLVIVVLVLSVVALPKFNPVSFASTSAAPPSESAPAPRAEALVVAFTVPPEALRPPVNEFAPERVSVPDPLCARASVPAPLERLPESVLSPEPANASVCAPALASEMLPLIASRLLLLFVHVWPLASENAMPLAKLSLPAPLFTRIPLEPERERLCAGEAEAARVGGRELDAADRKIAADRNRAPGAAGDSEQGNVGRVVRPADIGRRVVQKPVEARRAPGSAAVLSAVTVRAVAVPCVCGGRRALSRDEQRTPPAPASRTARSPAAIADLSDESNIWPTRESMSSLFPFSGSEFDQRRQQTERVRRRPIWSVAASQSAWVAGGANDAALRQPPFTQTGLVRSLMAPQPPCKQLGAAIGKNFRKDSRRGRLRIKQSASSARRRCRRFRR